MRPTGRLLLLYPPLPAFTYSINWGHLHSVSPEPSSLSQSLCVAVLATFSLLLVTCRPHGNLELTMYKADLVFSLANALAFV